MKSRQTPVILAFSGLAFWLQVTRLHAQSLWYDEGFSAWLASKPVAEIVARTAADIHPPFYYVLLHTWMALAGTSEFSLRFLSVMAGVPAVPLMWGLARRLVGRQAGPVAALLAAVAPVWLWYAQEARMYTLVTTLGLAATWALVRLLERPSRRLWFLYTTALLLAVYTQYYAWFLVAAHAVVAMLMGLGRGKAGWRTLWWPVAGWSLGFLAFLPWVQFVVLRLGADRSYWSGTLSPQRVLASLLTFWAAGHTIPSWLTELLPPLVLALLLGGHLILFVDRRMPRRKRWPVALVMAAWVIVPLVGLLFISWGRPKYHPRYLLFTVPAYWLAVTTLITRLAGEPGHRRRPIGPVLSGLTLGTVLGLAVLADINLYVDPAFTKDDWRSVARFLEEQRQPDEPVLLVSGHAFPVFTYYYRDEGWVPLPDSPTLDTSLVLGWGETARTLEQVLNGARGVWLVGWQNQVVDPDQIVPLIIAAAGGVEQPTPAFWGIEVRHWSFPHPARVPAEPPVQERVGANFGNVLELIGWSPPETPMPADLGLPITVYWALREPTERDIKVALNVVDAAGFLWGRLDRRPGNYFYPTFRWRPNDVRPGRYTIPLRPGTPPGTYFVELTAYTDDRPGGLDILDANGAPQGRRVRLGPVQVAPSTRPTTMYMLPEDADEHNVTLMSSVTLLASRTTPGGVLEPGQLVPVALWWRATDPPDANIRVHVGWRQDDTVRPAGDPILPGGEAWPTTRWRAGELVLTQMTARVPIDMPAGPATLVVWLQDESGRRSQDVSIGRFEVVESQRTFTPPTPQYPQSATFGDRIALVGYDVPEADIRPGGTVRVILYWQALAIMERSYKSFAHVLDGQGTYVAGDDHLPAEGARPTTTWMPGEYVRDEFTIVLPEQLPGPPYAVEVGWYDPSVPEMPRLPVQGEGADGSRVLLSTRLEEP